MSTTIQGGRRQPPSETSTGTRPPLQFSLGHLTVIDVEIADLIRIAARCGYDYVSPRLICGGLPGKDHSLIRNPGSLVQTRAALAETGLQIHDIELTRVADGIDVSIYAPDLALGAALGAHAVLASVWSTDRNQAIDDFGRLCRLAAGFGMTVNLEFVPIASVRTMADAVALIHAVNEPNARLMVDLHHLHRSRESIDDLLEVPAELFEFAQICDAPGKIPTETDEMTRIIREGRCYLGEGGTDPAAMLSRMPPMVYSIELPNSDSERALGPEGHARRCLETAREYLERTLSVQGRRL